MKPTFFERDFIKSFLGGKDNFDNTLKYLLEGNLEDFSYTLSIPRFQFKNLLE